MSSRSASQVVHANFQWESPNGAPTPDHVVRDATAIHSARQLESIAASLQFLVHELRLTRKALAKKKRKPTKRVTQ